MKNKLTDSESIAAISPDNARLISEFLDYLKSTQKSPATIGVYKNDLLIVMVWCEKHINNKFFVDWTKRDVIALQNWMINDNNNSPARVRRIKATLSSLSNYIETILDDEYPGFRNIIHKVESPISQAVREKTILSDEQIDQLLTELTNRKEFEKACLIALAVSSGRRKAELPLFKVSYFDDSNLICDGALYKTSEKIKTKGRGVNGKMIHCYTLAKRFKPYFDRWMEQRKSLKIESEWLFPNRENMNDHIGIGVLNRWARYFGTILGVDFYMHALRHAWTTSLIRAGLPETVIKDLAQWSSLDMVTIYNDCEAEEQFANYFANGDICVRERMTL